MTSRASFVPRVLIVLTKAKVNRIATPLLFVLFVCDLSIEIKLSCEIRLHEGERNDTAN